jgi:inorganic pyrophosphatase
MRPDLSPEDVENGALDWSRWESLIRTRGVTIDRPTGSSHPRFPEIVYPLDYGYVNATVSTDGEELDVFVGSARNGLVALLLTSDFRKGDREVKLLYDCTPEEIYLVNGFVNFDRTLMEGTLILRQPMSSLRRGARPSDR